MLKTGSVNKAHDSSLYLKQLHDAKYLPAFHQVLKTVYILKVDCFHKLGWTYRKNISNHHQRTKTRPRKRQLLQRMDMFGASSRPISSNFIGAQGQKERLLHTFPDFAIGYVLPIWKDSLRSLLVAGVCVPNVWVETTWDHVCIWKVQFFKAKFGETQLGGGSWI